MDMKVEQQCVSCGELFTRPNRRGGPSNTCSPECRENRRRHRLNRWRDESQCPGHLHGTLAGYTNYRCKCAACKSAFADYRRGLRAKKLEQAL